MHQTRASGVLVFRRSPSPSFLLMEHANRLDLPKGHVDKGETDIGCALRELEEETGIEQADIELDPCFRFTTQYVVRYKKKFGGAEAQKTVVIFLGWLRRDVPIRVSEHLAYRWVDWSPPHRIQSATIDPLLEQVAAHFAAHEKPRK